VDLGKKLPENDPLPQLSLLFAGPLLSYVYWQIEAQIAQRN
jgi:hypothetical protein